MCPSGTPRSTKQRPPGAPIRSRIPKGCFRLARQLIQPLQPKGALTTAAMPGSSSPLSIHGLITASAVADKALGKTTPQRMTPITEAANSKAEPKAGVNFFSIPSRAGHSDISDDGNARARNRSEQRAQPRPAKPRPSIPSGADPAHPIDATGPRRLLVHPHTGASSIP